MMLPLTRLWPLLRWGTAAAGAAAGGTPGSPAPSAAEARGFFRGGGEAPPVSESEEEEAEARVSSPREAVVGSRSGCAARGSRRGAPRGGCGGAGPAAGLSPGAGGGGGGRQRRQLPPLSSGPLSSAPWYGTYRGPVTRHVRRGQAGVEGEGAGGPAGRDPTPARTRPGLGAARARAPAPWSGRVRRAAGGRPPSRARGACVRVYPRASCKCKVCGATADPPSRAGGATCDPPCAWTPPFLPICALTRGLEPPKLFPSCLPHQLPATWMFIKSYLDPASSYKTQNLHSETSDLGMKYLLAADHLPFLYYLHHHDNSPPGCREIV
nr:translation initiation factor IF-2-like [Oryctolagus cuniculus]